MIKYGEVKNGPGSSPTVQIGTGNLVMSTSLPCSMFSLHGASLTIRGAIGFPRAWSHLRLIPSIESVSSPSA